MPTRRSNRNKRKHESNKKRDVSEILHKASCVSLNININKACPDYKPKIEGLCDLGRKRKPQKKYRNISNRNKCEQR